MPTSTSYAQAVRVERVKPRTTVSQSIRQFIRSPKGTLLAIFLGVFALGAIAVGWSVATPHMLIAVVGSSLTELVIDRLDGRLSSWPSSAILSGMIVGFVLEPATPHLITAAVAVLATIGKHLFATDRWHIFNPAALALLISAPLFGTSQSWWGALPDLSWPFALLLIGAGAFVVDRVNKFPLVLSFLGVLFGLSTVLGRIDPVTASEMFRTPFVQASLFLALFMVTDPPTAPARYGEQVAIGALVGGASVAAEALGAGQVYLLIGVLVGNVALALRRWQGQRRAIRRIAQAPTSVAQERSSRGPRLAEQQSIAA